MEKVIMGTAMMAVWVTLIAVVLLLVGALIGTYLSSGPSVVPKARTAHIVFDLETLGTTPGAVITNIGAHVVYPHEQGVARWGPTFYARIDHNSAVQWGLQEDPDTIAWWAKQTGPAREEVFSKDLPRTPMHTALADLRRFVQQFGPGVQVWGNGSDFDCAMLAVAYHAIGQKTPWEFWNTRCLRTLRAMHSDIHVERAPTSLAHHAMHDATYQAEVLLALADKGVVG
jgi:hypothetical protein